MDTALLQIHQAFTLLWTGVPRVFVFLVLLLVLFAIGAAGLLVEAVRRRWATRWSHSAEARKRRRARQPRRTLVWPERRVMPPPCHRASVSRARARPRMGMRAM